MLEIATTQKDRGAIPTSDEQERHRGAENGCNEFDVPKAGCKLPPAVSTVAAVMKSALLTGFLLGAIASCGYAQGTINFANAPNSLVKIGTSRTDPLAVPLTFPGYAQLFSAPAGTQFVPWSLGMTAPEFLAANPGWQFYGIPAPVNALVPGRFNGGTRTNTAIAPGGPCEAAVVAWQGNFATFEAAVAGGTLIGSSETMHLPYTGNFTLGAPTNPTPLPQAEGVNSAVLLVVPEPASLALVGLGMGVLLLRGCRRHI